MLAVTHVQIKLNQDNPMKLKILSGGATIKVAVVGSNVPSKKLCSSGIEYFGYS